MCIAIVPCEMAFQPRTTTGRDFSVSICGRMLTWRYLDADGEETGRSAEFADRDEAESWMGQAWSDLLDQGVEEVALHDEERGRRLYRMSLREA